MSVIAVDVARIRALNDQARTTFTGCYVDAERIGHLEPSIKKQLLQAVRDFSTFYTDDPEDEHDVGSIELDGVIYTWQITYFGPDWNCASIDPADPEETRRMLSIFRGP